MNFNKYFAFLAVLVLCILGQQATEAHHHFGRIGHELVGIYIRFLNFIFGINFIFVFSIFELNIIEKSWSHSCKYLCSLECSSLEIKTNETVLIYRRKPPRKLTMLYPKQRQLKQLLLLVPLLLVLQLLPNFSILKHLN